MRIFSEKLQKTVSKTRFEIAGVFDVTNYLTNQVNVSLASSLSELRRG